MLILSNVVSMTLSRRLIIAESVNPRWLNFSLEINLRGPRLALLTVARRVYGAVVSLNIAVLNAILKKVG